MCVFKVKYKRWMLKVDMLMKICVGVLFIVGKCLFMSICVGFLVLCCIFFVFYYLGG